MLVAALIPLGDMLIVLRHGGSKAVAFGIHLTTAIVVLISAALLFAASVSVESGVARRVCAGGTVASVGTAWSDSGGIRRT